MGSMHSSASRTQFSLEEEQLAFSMVPDQGEYLYNSLYSSPAPEGVSVLSRHARRSEMWSELPQRIISK